MKLLRHTLLFTSLAALVIGGCDEGGQDVSTSAFAPQTVAATSPPEPDAFSAEDTSSPDATTPDATIAPDAVATPDAVADADAGPAEDVVADTVEVSNTPDAAPDASAPDAPNAPDGTVTPDTALPPSTGPAVYTKGEIQSPITSSLAQHLRDIADTAPNLDDHVFMKIGASGTVSSGFLTCFSGSNIDWTAAPDGLPTTRDHFLQGDAAGDDPFSRKTLAAKVGMSTGWAISGDPSPMEEEFDLLQPRFALIAYGTNDMQLGTTFQSAMWGFGDKLQTLIDTLIGWGVVPILQTNGARLDNAEADRFVDSYNAIIRAIAQSRQIPLMDLWTAMSQVPGWGKSGDGLHLNTYSGGGCIFTEEALDYGYNTRNMATLEGLHRAKLAVVDEVESLDGPTVTVAGDGSPQAPWEVQAFPFSTGGDTSSSPWSEIDVYGACSSSNESGPEDYYQITLEAETSLRIMVHDQGDVDVDLHLLDETGTPEGCITRAHQLIETTLPAGTYTLVVDSWVDSGGDVHDGSYLLAIVECHPDDPSCD